MLNIVIQIRILHNSGLPKAVEFALSWFFFSYCFDYGGRKKSGETIAESKDIFPSIIDMEKDILIQVYMSECFDLLFSASKAGKSFL